MGQITGKLHNNYVKFDAVTGQRKRVYVYALKMDDAQKEQYINIQGDKYREDEETGAPLHFTNKYVSDFVALNFNKNGTKLYIDDSMFDKINDMCMATPAMAGAMAEQFLAAIGFGNIAKAAEQPKAEESQEASTENINDNDVV